MSGIRTGGFLKRHGVCTGGQKKPWGEQRALEGAGKGLGGRQNGQGWRREGVQGRNDMHVVPSTAFGILVKVAPVSQERR